MILLEKKINEFATSLSGKRIDKIQLNEINLDFFGFSRGATCARFSCKSFLENEKQGSRCILDQLNSIFFDKNKIDISALKVKIKNVGIFDSVASYTPYGIYREKSSTNILFLDSIAKAENVFHIIAKDEFRKNFALTNNNSNGKSKDLPGAHSDIGGGYHEEESENKIIYSSSNGKDIVRVTNWLIDENWVQETKVVNKISKFEYYSEVKNGLFSNSIRINRPKILNKYSRIALYYMTDYFKSDLEFNLKSIDVSLDQEMKELKKAIEEKNHAEIKKARLKYMHFSGADNIGYALRENDNKEGVPFKRKVHDG